MTTVRTQVSAASHPPTVKKRRRVAFAVALVTSLLAAGVTPYAHAVSNGQQEGSHAWGARQQMSPQLRQQMEAVDRAMAQINDNSLKVGVLGSHVYVRR